MTTSALDRIPVDEITARAREVKPGRSLLTLVAAMLFGIGWVLAKMFAVTWLGFTWCWAAVSVGWTAAHGPSRRAQIEGMTAEIERLSTEVRRLGGR